MFVWIRKKAKRKLFICSLLISIGITSVSLTLSINSGEAEASVAKKTKPKNVILMISDGCGYNHILATDYYTGKKQVYERFPVRLGMTTYEYEDTESRLIYYDPENPDNSRWSTKSLLGYDPVRMWQDFYYSAYPLATDSASAATAMASGVKTYNGAIGVDLDGNPVELVTERAEKLGKSTGVVTTVQWSHATPAGFVAHNASRNEYAEIAREMIYDSAVDVVMGAGHPWFDNNGNPVSTPNTFKYVGDESTWNELVAGTAGGDADGDGDNDPWTLIQTKEEFQALTIARKTPSRVCGTAQVYTTLQQAREGDGGAAHTKFL